MSSVIQTILKKKSVFLVLLLVVVGFAFSAQGAAAWGGCGITDIGCHINSVLLLALKGLAIVLGFVAQITNWAMQPSHITSSPFVQAGWSATRDFANSLFILILLGIALSFILYDSFGVKRALPKLLLIALLINFSVPIAGVALDFANIISAHFLASVSNTSGFTEAIAQNVGLSHVFDEDYITGADKTGGQAQSALAVGDDSFISILFAMGIVIGMIFIFLALAAMFLIRTGYISVLLILLPIALVLSAFPPTSKHFSKWTSKFMQWTMFAPAATFFLYLSMLVLTTTGSNGVLSMGGGTAITPQSPVFNLLRYIMAWGLMLMSLTVAQSMGITGASTAMAMWSKGTKWARGKAGNYTKRGVEKVGGARVLEEAQKLAAKAPIVGGFGARYLGGAAATIRSAKREAAELTKGEKDLIETGNDMEVTNMIQGYAKGTADQRAKAAKMVTLAERKGKLKIKDAKGNIDFDATRKMKEELRLKAKAIGDFEAVKAIDRSDFSIAEKAINEKFDAYKNEGRVVDPDTGKEREESRHRKLAELYRKVDLGKEEWDDSVVNEKFMRNLIKYGGASGERFKQARRSGNTAIIEELDKYMGKVTTDEELAREFMSKENQAFLNWLKKTGAKDFVGNHNQVIENLEQKKTLPNSKNTNTEEQKLRDEVEEFRRKKDYTKQDEENNEEKNNNI